MNLDGQINNSDSCKTNAFSLFSFKIFCLCADIAVSCQS